MLLKKLIEELNAILSVFPDSDVEIRLDNSFDFDIEDILDDDNGDVKIYISSPEPEFPEDTRMFV